VKFDFNGKLPPLELDIDGQAIRFEHDRLGAGERMEAVAALNRGIAGLQGVLWPKVTDWSGVEDADGYPVELGSIDGATKRPRDMDALVGMLPFGKQLEVVLLQLRANGIRLRPLRAVALELAPTAAEAERLVALIDGGAADAAEDTAASGTAGEE